MPPLQFMPRARHEELVVQISGQETLIYDQKTHQAHCLNPAAAGVWKYCDGRTAVADAASIVGRELGIAVDAEFVLCAIDQLRVADLLVEATRSASAVSRRHVLQRLGTTGVAAALAPLVTSL
ncbi:MAG: twin-arginine translocation signal domain-containing protein, partial [Planctomycetota bacterium]